jgi:hypothetical protein
MQLLPDLSECLAIELTQMIARVAEPYRQQVESMLPDVFHSESVDLKGSLALWLAGMKPAVMVKHYNQLRQLIRVAEEIIREQENQ